MSASTKVCIYAPVHIHTDVRVYQKEAKAIASAGYSVVLLARKDDALGEEAVSGQLTVEGVPRYKSRLQRFLLQPLMLGKILKTKATIVHLHNPDTLLLGFLLKLLGKTVIYDTHEDFTQRILMREWIPLMLRKYVAKAVGKLESWAGRVFDAAIATQADVADRLGEKSIVLENAPISRGELIKRAYAHSLNIPKSTEFRVIYAGTIGRTRGLLQMVKALEYVNQLFAARLWLIGPVHDPAAMEEAQARVGWMYVDYLGSLPQEQAFAYMIRSDVGLVTIQDIGDHAKTSPNKIFEYQRFGIPFIASDFAAWRKKVGHVGAGVFVNQEDAVEIAQMITLLHDLPHLAKEMGQKGMAFTVNEYNWETESEKLIRLYRSLSPRQVSQQEQAQPLVSVITPTYNAARFIKETIESVKRQTYPNWELILVDDGSKDETVALIQEELRDPRIHLMVLPVNSGAAVARNTGMAAARGRYLAFLDSDDLWLSQKLEKQVSFMQQNDVAFSFTQYRVISENGAQTPFVVQIPERIDYRGLLKNTIIGCLTVMLDREKLGDVQMPNIRTRQDTALWLQILKQGHIAYGIQEELSHYRKVEGSISSNKWKAARNTWRLYREREKLNLVFAAWCFLHYGWNAWKKSMGQS